MIKSWPSLSELRDQVQSGNVSAVSLVEKSIAAIENKKQYQAIISVNKENAINTAKMIDKKISNGDKVGRLAGIPFIVKDNFLTTNLMTTAASNMLKDFKAPYQATAINLLEKEGAIMVAKANLDAFAHGASTENSDFMVTKNPFDETRVPGGSSGGSAVAVILGMAPFALGTDTGGSIRMPASFCGVVGYKPSYGLVSRSGVVAMASSLDVVGPLTSNVNDASLILDIISGIDSLDSTTIVRDTESYDLQLINKMTTIKDLKIGILTDFLKNGVDSKIKQNVFNNVTRLKSMGAQIVDISIPSIALSLPAYYIICPAEISSNLSRYDGLRYGYHTNKTKNLEEYYSSSRSYGFGKEAKRRIMIGTYVLSSGYYDAYYKKAQQVRTKLINEINGAFKQVDFIVGPTTPILPFKIGEKTMDPLQMYLSDLMTVLANLVGIPAISLPSKMINNLPVGFQVMAPQKSDKKLLEFAKLIEDKIK